MPGVRAEERIIPRRFGSHKAKGLNRIFLKEFCCVEDAFIVWNEALLGGLGVGSHTIGRLTDFLDGAILVEDEQVVLGDVGV